MPLRIHTLQGSTFEVAGYSAVTPKENVRSDQSSLSFKEALRKCKGFEKWDAQPQIFFLGAPGTSIIYSVLMQLHPVPSNLPRGLCYCLLVHNLAALPHNCCLRLVFTSDGVGVGVVVGVIRELMT